LKIDIGYSVGFSKMIDGCINNNSSYPSLYPWCKLNIRQTS